MVIIDHGIGGQPHPVPAINYTDRLYIPNQKKMNMHVLLVPFPVQGHVNSMMNFSQKLVEHGCKITFVNSEFTHKRVMSSMAKQESIDESPIKLVSIPDGLAPDDDRTDVGELCVSILSNMPNMLEKLIEDIHMNGGDKITCIVADVIMGWALEVGSKQGIKGVLFWTSSATMYALQYKIPKLIEDGIIDSDDGFPITEKTFQISPNMPTMDTRVIWWSNVYDRTTEKKVFNYIVQCLQYSNLTEWCICNTTHELEPKALSFVPKLLPVGPLLRTYDNTNSIARSLGQFWKEDHSCINWLNQQPPCSVLYVAFGSFTLFDQNQFNELALGLDLTNSPFLWVVRQDNKMTYPYEFLGIQGKIVGWTPQLKVLSHSAIAGFVSHCGWNSIIEGLSNGVPFLCWPYFTDQFYNKSYICDELKVGLGLNSDENGLVSRWEIKKKLHQLLCDEQIRARSLQLKEMVVNNISEGGGSSKNISRFVEWLKY